VAGRPGFRLGGVDVNLAGEALRRHDVAALGSGIGQLRNLYGPSEATTYASMARIDLASSAEPTIGTLLPHLGGFVAGPRGRPVVEGVRGQLVLSGSALTSGYVADPRLTADRLRPDPDGAGDRLYLTGDLVTWRHGGLHFHGREDRQVKLSGQRVELDEIEVWLGRHPLVEAAGVVVVEGRRRLVVGHVQVGHPAPTERDLRRWMAERLPPYMVCDRIVVVDALPLNRNGKVDHLALAVAGLGERGRRMVAEVAGRSGGRAGPGPPTAEEER
jgi:acyl-coenzyme A synthetase/AMP-(fatty) acid ligase